MKIINQKGILIIFLMLNLYTKIISEEEDPYIVRINSGLIKGFDQEGTMAFLGIPYAKVERFMPPLPVDNWDGVRVCDHWGPQVMQNTNREMSEEEMSEKNSCVLNVWTTDKKGKQPVMLWIHGGGFDSGTSAWDPGMVLAKSSSSANDINAASPFAS